MKLIAASVTLALAGAAHAELPVGNFNQPHNPGADALWAIKPAGKGYTFQEFSFGTPIPAHRYSVEERKQLWDKFWLEANTHLDAECIGSKEDIICYVPPATRKKIGDYRLYDHNYVRFRGGTWREVAKTSNRLGDGSPSPYRPER